MRMSLVNKQEGKLFALPTSFVACLFEGKFQLVPSPQDFRIKAGI